MQSHLEAALLGHGSGTNPNMIDDDDRFDPEEEDIDEFIDEVPDECEIGQRAEKANTSNASISKTVTLQMLLSADVLQPGEGTMSIEYLGQKFVGDLLDDGKIRSQETDIIFASPSAWAIACKRFINPDKKSGCGWASVKYRGRKLDAYKNVWYKKKKDEILKLQREEISEGIALDILEANRNNQNMTSHYVQRVIVKHNTIANRTFTHDSNTMIECVPFSNLGKIQPFLVSLSTNAALLMDFHCHLTASEVSGYLAGQWDVNAHNLQITHCFPCRNTKADREHAPQVELEIQKAIEKQKLILVGWYHSHPFSQAAPTLRDIDAQLDYQIRMKGLTDNSYTPCIGLIISPYNYENSSLESNIIAYWIIPPPENKPNEYGRPMLMSYSVVQDANLAPTSKEEMKKCVTYYKKEKDFIKFTEKYTNSASFIEKLKSTLISKFPRDQSDATLWGYIRDLVGCSVDEEGLLSIPTIPSVSKSQLLSNLNTSVSLNSNLMLSSDIANVLFNSGKFPSATSLLGLPDPMAHSTLAANNMFLQSNLFKMQELLKPLSTSSPISKSKSDTKTSTSTSTSCTPLKIPTDLKKMDFQNDLNLLSLKNKLEYANSELNLGLSPSDFTKKSKIDFSASDLSIPSSKFSEKRDFSMSDFSILSNKSSKFDYSDFSISSAQTSATDFSLDLSRKDDGEKTAKIPKFDYSSLDLSSFTKNMSDFPKNLSDFPKNLGDFPKNLGDFPKNLGDFPKNMSDFPKNMSDFPNLPKGLSVTATDDYLQSDTPMNLAPNI